MDSNRDTGNGTLRGQVAVVTGGGRGIGRAIARALAEVGAAVAVVARSESDLAETVALIAAAGGRAVALTADVTDQAAVERMVQETERHLGPVDVLVNNAGSAETIGPLWEIDPELWWRDLEINLRGVLLCTWAVLPRMIARHKGRIINVSSYAGARPVPYMSSYTCAKAAVARLTDTLAAETKEHGVQVFAISPGYVRTRMTERLIESPEGQKWVPRFQAMSPEDWVPPERAAQLVVFLVSGQGDKLSGRFLNVADDIPALVQRAEEIERDDLYALRLRK